MRCDLELVPAKSGWGKYWLAMIMSSCLRDIDWSLLSAVSFLLPTSAHIPATWDLPKLLSPSNTLPLHLGSSLLIIPQKQALFLSSSPSPHQSPKDAFLVPPFLSSAKHHLILDFKLL